MGLLSRAGDLVYTFRFLKLLVTPFEETNAFKMGLIDAEGNKIKKPAKAAEKAAYNAFHRLVFNIKKLMAKAPGGSSRLASYAAALYLIKEHMELDDASLQGMIDKMELPMDRELSEQHEWFVTPDRMLSPGVYKIPADKMSSTTCEEISRKNDRIRVAPDSFPVGQVMNIDIYEALHLNTNQRVYVTIGELIK